MPPSNKSDDRALRERIEREIFECKPDGAGLHGIEAALYRRTVAVALRLVMEERERADNLVFMAQGAQRNAEGLLGEAVQRAEAAEQKLQRVRDALKHQANSEGGLVAEVDDALRALVRR